MLAANDRFVVDAQRPPVLPSYTGHRLDYDGVHPKRPTDEIIEARANPPSPTVALPIADLS